MPGKKKSAKNQKKTKSCSKNDSSNEFTYCMRLFIADSEPNSVSAQKVINEICSEYLNDNYQLEVIDVFENEDAALKENIIVTPALIIDKPQKSKIIGNLKNKDKVLSALDLL